LAITFFRATDPVFKTWTFIFLVATALSAGFYEFYTWRHPPRPAEKTASLTEGKVRFFWKGSSLTHDPGSGALQLAVDIEVVNASALELRLKTSDDAMRTMELVGTDNGAVQISGGIGVVSLGGKASSVTEEVVPSLGVSSMRLVGIVPFGRKADLVKLLQRSHREWGLLPRLYGKISFRLGGVDKTGDIDVRGHLVPRARSLSPKACRLRSV
jgi:hypothetical protein